ncbi:division/cell wall cluster transcriptional repressor MraZ [Magnetospira thiophila]
MTPLIGRHINKIDAKGRVSVPKPFRAAFADQSFPGIYVYPRFQEPALEACGADYMVRLSESLEDPDALTDEQRLVAAAILDYVHPLAFDPEGRVVLPQELLDHAHLSAQAVFVGKGERFLIWEPEAYESHRKASFAHASKHNVTMALGRLGKPGGGA